MEINYIPFKTIKNQRNEYKTYGKVKITFDKNVIIGSYCYEDNIYEVKAYGEGFGCDYNDDSFFDRMAYSYKGDKLNFNGLPVEIVSKLKNITERIMDDNSFDLLKSNKNDFDLVKEFHRNLFEVENEISNNKAINEICDNKSSKSIFVIEDDSGLRDFRQGNFYKIVKIIDDYVVVLDHNGIERYLNKTRGRIFITV